MVTANAELYAWDGSITGSSAAGVTVVTPTGVAVAMEATARSS